jgi:chromosome segregation ATPase
MKIFNFIEMKLKITLLCVLMASLNAQLFDSIGKKPSLRQNGIRQTNQIVQRPHASVPGTDNSLFQNFYQKNEHKVVANKVTSNVAKSNSLFQASSAPVVEKKTVLSQKPVIQAKHEPAQKHENHLNRREINEEVHSFLEKSKKISSKIKNNEKTLNNLNTRIEELVKKNNNIREELKKYKSLKKGKKHIEEKVENFIEKYQGEVQNIESTIVEKTEKVEKKLKEKTQNLDQIYKDVVSNYSNLQVEVDLVKDKLEEIVKFS